MKKVSLVIAFGLLIFSSFAQNAEDHTPSVKKVPSVKLKDMNGLV